MFRMVRWCTGAAGFHFVYKTAQKEEFSLAYVHAVAACANCALDKFRVDYDKADVILRFRGSADLEDPRIELQLKCSASIRPVNGKFRFKIPVDLYDRLRSTRRMVPLFLVIMHVPPSPHQWMRHKASLAELRHRAFFVDLRGNGPSPTPKAVRIDVSCARIFDAPLLTSLMQRALKGEFLPKQAAQ